MRLKYDDEPLIRKRASSTRKCRAYLARMVRIVIIDHCATFCHPFRFKPPPCSLKTSEACSRGNTVNFKRAGHGSGRLGVHHVMRARLEKYWHIRLHTI